MDDSRKPFTMDEIFWGNVRREFTENILKEDGDFMVRKTTNGDFLVLSVFWDDEIMHFQPHYDGSEYSLGDVAFPNLEAVIHHHLCHEVPLGEDTDVLLIRPIKKMKTLFRLSDVDILGVLGEGNFGKVYKVRIKQDGSVVAMKTLKGNVSKAVRDTFIKELALMQTMEHENVVKCLGVIDEGDGQLRILLEMVNKGSLDKLLRETQKLTIRGKVRTILDVASGMAYLHRMGIIHRDLAARNILLHLTNDGKIVGKVSDFGLSRQDESGHGYELKTASKLPAKWMAPECFKAKRWTKASDVWSFGVLMWEVFTDCAEPYDDVPEAQGSNIIKFISGGGHVTRPEECRDDIWDLMLQIFDLDDAERVTMDEVHDELDRIYTLIKMEDEDSSGHVSR